VARPRRPVDPEVARYYEEPVEYEEARESVLWEREMGQVRRGVILGAPGGGKTFLTRWTALRLAEESLKRLDEGTPLEDLPLPVHVELPRLAKHLGGTPEDALGACLAEAFPAEGGEAALRRVLALLRDRDKGWLILDAWDQVPEGEWGALREWLRAVDGWQCRVVLTCRKARYDEHALPWREAPEYELEPLGEEGIRQLFERWFGDGRGRSLWEAVRGNPSLVEACRSPLVASLTCLVHQEGGLRMGFRRGDLYDEALRLLLRRGWGRLGRGGSNMDLGRRLEVLREAAWELFRVRPEVNDFGQSEAEEAIRGALESLRYDKLGLDELMGEWLEAGILLEAGWERGEMRVAFLHRSFVEYLAGLALARRLERDWDGWAEFVDRKAWHPAWREALVFTGWALKEEVLKRLVGLLADPKRDDHFRHRLGLALRILAERV
jgi:predicted NACHT family NTPase